MRSQKRATVSHSMLNNKKEIMNDDKKMNFLREKKKTMDVYRKKKNSLDLYKQKKKSMDLHRLRISKPINLIEKRKVNTNNSFASLNVFSKMNKSKMDLYNSRVVSDLDYREIQKEIKNVILDMKNEALLEIGRQSRNELKLYKKKPQLKRDLTSSNSTNTIKYGDLRDSQYKKKKYRRSKTNYGSCNRNMIMKNKSRNNTKNTNESVDSSKILNDNKIISLDTKTTLKTLRLKTESKSFTEKFRFYGRGGVIEDSFNESESDEDYEEDSFLINPETTTFLIYDIIIFIASLYSSIIIPYDLTNECICYQNKKSIKFYLNYGIDILFFIDLIIHFFLEYYSKKDKLIKNRMKIIDHYLKGWFLFDFLTALPFNILYYYYCKKFPSQICHTYENNNITYYLAILKYLKSIKIFKMPVNKKNIFIARLTEEASNNPSLYEKVYLTIELLFVLFGLHISSCIHIFIGRFTYPGWIFANEFQNFSLLNIYMISIYYLIQTMTTVGYGDISSDSFIEIIFRIILLAVGVIIYSWLISNIINRINKQSYASMNFSNDLLLLENIRIDHADLPFNLYANIKNYLELKHFRRNIYDKNLLINSLAYSLRNNLIFSMYKTELERFPFFKGISNTNFLSELLYNFSSVICKRNEVLMNENEIIEEIIFVKEGRLSLELPIDMENPEISTEEYLSQEFMNFAFKFDKRNKLNIDELNISKRSITSLLEEKKKPIYFISKMEN